MNGIIVIDKQKDWTSFDVVAKLRGIFHEKRIGHGGTLDPMATGVLPVFVGKAARACDILPDETKAYEAEFRLGVTTDTLDITGKILSERTADKTMREVELAAEKFVGDIMQIPPMYSAVKVGGKKLCNLAREGVTIERPPRPVTVYEIVITAFDEKTQSGSMSVRCRKGTYIRSVIDDMGKELGCGAVMTELRRTYSAGFDIKNSYTIAQVEEMFKNGQTDGILMSVDKAFEGVYNKIASLDKRLTPLYKNGVKLSVGQTGLSLSDGISDNEKILVYGFDEEFLGLAQITDETLKSIKNFY